MNLFFILFPTLFIFFGCQQESASSHLTPFTGTAMTMDYKILIGKKLSPKQIHTVEQIIQETFDETHQIYNKWNPLSELSKLNQSKAHHPIPLSPQLEHLLKLSDEIYSVSEKRFDPTIEPLQQLWKSYLEKNSVPPPEEIASLLEVVGWEKIHIENHIFYKDHDLSSLDLGGIAKGLCIDCLVENLNKAGYLNVMVEWGGEIRASGHHPEGRPWNVYISRLGDIDPSSAIATFSLYNQGLATSGDYLQNWTVKDSKDQETTYFHILDPLTLRPLKIEKNSIASASVLAPTCALADGLATAIMLFPSATEAHEWAENLKIKYPFLSFWIITRK